MAKPKNKKKPVRRRRPSTILNEYNKQLIVFPKSAGQHVPKVNKDVWLRMLASRQFSKLAKAILQYLLYFEENHYNSYSSEDIDQFDNFVELVTLTIGDPQCALTKQEYGNLIMVSHLFSSIVATSSYRTTDVLLKKLLRQRNNVPRLLFAQNARNEVQIPPQELFKFETSLASAWYGNYMLTVSQPTKRTLENQYSHLHAIDERWIPTSHFVSSLYFTCTYFSPDNVREVKRVLNTSLKKAIEGRGMFKINNTPKKGRIAVVTGKWHRNHAVYKSQAPLLNQILDDYDVSLYHVGSPESTPDTLVTDGFSSVENLWIEDQTGKPNIPKSFSDNDFELIYYPDIGMSNESVWLSNVRAAPIQVMGYGHPDTSGDNSEIDYFIGGHIEEDATDHYSETMVLIPGLAQEPAWPSYERKFNYNDDDVVRINCVWGPDKYNYNLLRLLQMINERVQDKAKLEYHFFTSPGVNRYAALVPFIREVSETLQNFVVHSQQEYYDYMENAEQHDFSLNSFPFGGYNTVVESLYLGLPQVTMEGGRFYNRASAYLLKQVGMPELIANTPQEFINITADLVLNRTKLKEYRQALADMDLKAKLFTLEGDYFKQAIDHIIAQHPIKETVKIG